MSKNWNGERFFDLDALIEASQYLGHERSSLLGKLEMIADEFGGCVGIAKTLEGVDAGPIVLQWEGRLYAITIVLGSTDIQWVIGVIRTRIDEARVWLGDGSRLKWIVGPKHAADDGSLPTAEVIAATDEDLQRIRELVS